MVGGGLGNEILLREVVVKSLTCLLVFVLRSLDEDAGVVIQDLGENFPLLIIY